jgi:hypothetical protein
VSNVWETRYRLLVEQVEALAVQLRAEEPIDPSALEEQTVRLLAAATTLLRQHRVNKRGQCNYCGWMRPVWRLWRRRPQCTVYRSLDFALRQPLDVVSFPLFQRAPDFPAEQGKPSLTDTSANSSPPSKLADSPGEQRTSGQAKLLSFDILADTCGDELPSEIPDSAKPRVCVRPRHDPARCMKLRTAPRGERQTQASFA